MIHPSQLVDFVDIHTEAPIKPEYERLGEEASKHRDQAERYNLEADDWGLTFDRLRRMDFSGVNIVHYFSHRWAAKRQYRMGDQRLAESEGYYALIEGAEIFLEQVNHGNN